VAWWQIYTDAMFGVMADAVLTLESDGSYSLVSGTDDTAAMQRMSNYMRSHPGRYFIDGGVRRVWPDAITHESRLMDVRLDVRSTNGVMVEYVNDASIHAQHPNPDTDGAFC